MARVERAATKVVGGGGGRGRSEREKFVNGFEGGFGEDCEVLD